MVVDPKDTLVTTPVEPTVATPLLLLVQAPPGVASARLVENPLHIDGMPVIGDKELMVSVAVDAHPVGNV
jgi:hypothetical protein